MVDTDQSGIHSAKFSDVNTYTFILNHGLHKDRTKTQRYDRCEFFVYLWLISPAVKSFLSSDECYCQNISSQIDHSSNDLIKTPNFSFTLSLKNQYFSHSLFFDLLKFFYG